jgi:ABC-type multidrug transport system permease subunit
MTRHPLFQLMLSRLREFYREPEALFWTYGFPVLLTLGLGLAFRNRPPEQVEVGIEAAPATAEIRATLEADDSFLVRTGDADETARMLRTGKVAILVRPTADGYEYRFDPTRPEAALARAKLDDALQRAAGRADAVPAGEVHVSEPGARYIDFLVPGLIGMNLMGGGLWGVGFVTVDMRIRKLLKRLIATPMRKRDFLLATVGGRMLFTLPEMAVLLLAAWLMFNVTMVGSLSATIVIILIGAMSFAGLGLLIACRASKIETVSGLMNVVMLPMWILSGTFFSSERFPDAMQPFVQALPLTQLNNALRGVMLEGESLASQAMPLLILTAWGGGSFVLGLRWFRWT